jgi:hypothetical protein
MAVLASGGQSMMCFWQGSQNWLFLQFDVAFHCCWKGFWNFQDWVMQVRFADCFQVKVTFCMLERLKVHCVWKEVVVFPIHL